MSDIPNIVKQIQSDIINPQVSLGTILLKAKVLAHYLGNPELKKWVKNELDGYPNTDNLPDYRITSTALLGTFYNGVYWHSNKIISIVTIPSKLRESVGKVYFPQGIAGLEEMAKKSKDFRNPMPGDWVDLYNIFNAESLSHGHYQLIEAHHPITDTSIVQTLGAIRSRLQDFVLEISSLPWDMVHEPPPAEQIAKIFQVTIYHNSWDRAYHAGEVGLDTHPIVEGNNPRFVELATFISVHAEELRKVSRPMQGHVEPSARFVTLSHEHAGKK